MHEQTVNYFENFEGFYVEPTQDVQNRALHNGGVVVIHEVWGLNDTIKTYARELGKAGYRVLAVDLFGETFDASDEASQKRAFAAMTSLDQVKANANMQEAVKFLRDKGAQCVGSVGFCMGGAQSLQLALSGEEMNATAMYYGRPIADAEKLKAIHWPIIGFFGGLDKHITPAIVEEFKKALLEAGVENDITIYPNANHAFARPSGPHYNPEAAADAWGKLLAFFKANL